MTDLALLGRAAITGKILLLSGLHIGAGKDVIEIGGIDNPVIKHPHTQEPYIPGSSIKGRLRFLLEWAFDKIRQDGQPWGANERSENATADEADPILRIFGSPIGKEVWKGGPTRLLVRDAMLDGEWRQHATDRGLPLTEEKTEVVIDRIAGKAHDRIGPRQTERVPAGAKFDLDLVFRVYDTGDGGARDEECLNWLLAGLSLLEQDALGGSGSRGYGRVRFEGLQYRDLDGKQHAIDNRFRVERFDPHQAPRLVTLKAA
ncbi:type III-A CRISPR-associated RAMP protein Csm3 [Vineibacter terrae]|uniref:CRISPR system Cms endoribonuclease Csm3 n=1 Tax=Vineibacter terrae TaxID=2586908 RepID=A0A5C8PV06_9HYPH|nr:type III-A CRISPR-associated RAMP protein Csm3 [Vineibacter terrae]TXL82057.1 type III-A CRISPR-associated RAMP protein Csm3 [Vineibacter terrae]